MPLSTYLGVIAIRLLHGLEPGHGWPVAALYSLKKKNKYLSGILSSLIIAFFHFFSSIAVVLIFIFLDDRFQITSFSFMRYAAAALLLYMAYRFWTHHEHASLDKKKHQSLWSIAAFAFVLGFIHEEEFALLAFCVDKINCLALMISYATAVSLSIVTITLAAIHAYGRIEHRMHHYEHLLPKISAVILLALALLFLFRVF